MRFDLDGLLAKLERSFVDPKDTDEQRMRKRALVLGLTASVMVSLLGGAAFFVLGLWPIATLSFAAAAMDALLVAGLKRHQSYRAVLWAHMGANLILPFVAQALMGGILPSGCVGLWAVVAPLTAVVQEMGGAWVWFLAFLALQALALLQGLAWRIPALPPSHELSLMLLAGNLTGVFSILYFPLQYLNKVRRGLQDKVQAQSQALALEHAKTERLLLNILPAPVAERLKLGRGLVCEAYPDVSILFADITGFTTFSAGLPARELVTLLDSVFSLFDALAEENGLEKIKTIGDAYMVAGNVPAALEDHMAITAEMALQMQGVFQEHALAARGLNLRMGMHCGPVVAGVIGTSKFSFDMWGDTVNIASRLESHSEAGRIQVSDAAHLRLKDRYQFEARGSIELRGRGSMRTWWLKGRA